MGSGLIEDGKVSLRTVVIISATIISVIGGLGSAGVWNAATTLSDIHRDIGDLKSNSLTRSEASALALRAAMENPGLRVPDPSEPGKVLTVVRQQGEHP